MVNKENNNHKAGFKKRVDELVNKDMIKPEQKAGLKNMIDSPDQESFQLAQDIIELKLEDQLVIGLNDEQTHAFNEILDFLKAPAHNAFVLKGYAGTGKTFLVKRIIEYITATFPNRKIAITAPTNKAVRVLQDDAPFQDRSEDQPIMEDLFKAGTRIKYSTVHKLLGLKEKISNTGVQSFTPDYKDKSELDKYKYLIVDEVSMLDDMLCRELLRHPGLLVIFMGDPAQIPPVGKRDCIPFREQDEYGFRMVELQEIMRQTGDHPVVDAGFILRNNLTEKQPIPVLKTNVTAEGKGIVYINALTERKLVRPILKEYFDSPEFEADADYAKVIAWTNKTVNYLNSIIREILFTKEAELYVVGEKLIARGPIFKEQQGKQARWGSKWVVDINTSEEMEIVEITIQRKKFLEGSYELYAQIYQCKIKIYDAIQGEYVTNYINIIHETSTKEYHALMAKAKKLAMTAKDKSAWVAFYNMQKWSAAVSYNYAITAHKAQGSTYGNVVLLEEDLDKNRNVVERNRIKYTAYSRPTHKLFILRKNY